MSEIVVIIRPSFKKVCGPDAARAALYNHILYRLAMKAKAEPDEKVKRGEVFWYASAEDICSDIDGAWCVNKVRKEVKQLATSGLLGQRHNPIKKWDRKFQYFISEIEGVALREKAKEAGVCLLHIGLKAEVLHLLHMVNAFDKNGGCICQKEEIDLPDMGVPSTTNGGAIPEGSSNKESTEESENEGENAGASAPPARAEHPLHEISDLRERTNAALEELEGPFNPETWNVEQTVRASDRVPPFASGSGRASPSIDGAVTQGNRPSQHTSSDPLSRRSHTGAAPARTPPAVSPAASASGSRQGARDRPTPVLTPRGADVRGWLETILQASISADEDAPDNIRALNVLGRNPDVTEESLRLTIALVKALQFVKDHDIAVDAQLLASSKSRLNFEKNWPTARDKRQRAGPADVPETDTPEPGGYYPYPQFAKKGRNT